MLVLVGLVLSIGLADSLNPSTIGPALYLAAGRDAGRNLLGFTAGVFAVSGIGGVVLVVGPGRALLTHRANANVTHAIELGAGAALVVVAAGLWLARRRLTRHIGRNARNVRRGPIVLGAGIMAVELPTALPYFAAIVSVASSGRTVAAQILLIVLFNVAFITPLLAILAIRQLSGARGQQWLASTRERIEEHAGALAPALVLLVAVVLLAIGGVGLGRHR